MLVLIGGFIGFRSCQPVTHPSNPYAFALCGSNTIGSELGPDLVRAYLSSVVAQNIDSTVSGDEQTLTSRLNGTETDVHVAAHGSATAFDGLAAGDCQVGMASRQITRDEAERLKSLGNMFSSGAEHVIGLDGIAVIVSQTNPISELTVAQLKEIFTGKKASWSGVVEGRNGIPLLARDTKASIFDMLTALVLDQAPLIAPASAMAHLRDVATGRTGTWTAMDGGGRPINVYARDTKSGTFDTFTALVLDREPLVTSARRFEDSSQLSLAVARDPDAIGFIGLPYVGQAKPLRIASGARAIAPTKLTVGRESYPLTRRLFLYTAETATSSLVRKFISFVQSDAGQTIVNKDGFVGTVSSLATSRPAEQSLPPDTPAQYRALVDELDQVNFSFYFDSSSDKLDNKAYIDVGRLVGILSIGSNRSKKVALAGFSDASGDPTVNQRLSEDRAKAVAAEIKEQGVAVEEVFGFGQELPIRDNATEAGRQKNRRVEIFLTR